MTTAKERMLSYLDESFYANSQIMQALMDSRGKEIDDLRFTLDEILRQFSILTATFTLKEWEEQYGLPVNEGVNIETRRQQVLAQKRLGRRGLLNTLQALEPNLSLAWGRLILPFTIVSEVDQHDFGPLIVLLEKRKPAHTGYSFRILPSLQDSGYTVYAHHLRRNEVNLELKAGTAMAGRWPKWNSAGSALLGTIELESVPVSGDGIFEKTGGLYSGHIRAASGVGFSLGSKAVIQENHVTAISTFPLSGIYKSGEAPIPSSIGSLVSTSAVAMGTALTGTGHEFACGSAYCGEEVA
ncbi:putative phage tail protein [Cohnella massiliensis]|uniref:putative phage tail protein n=1 Tax=Cohnella massiliensis TaxID=1816691 RepID=UPI0009BC664B|nr:putative phage tail protein [Cohnella massiliensis]